MLLVIKCLSERNKRRLRLDAVYVSVRARAYYSDVQSILIRFFFLSIFPFFFFSTGRTDSTVFHVVRDGTRVSYPLRTFKGSRILLDRLIYTGPRGRRPIAFRIFSPLRRAEFDRKKKKQIQK